MSTMTKNEKVAFFVDAVAQATEPHVTLVDTGFEVLGHTFEHADIQHIFTATHKIAAELYMDRAQLDAASEASINQIITWLESLGQPTMARNLATARDSLLNSISMLKGV